MATKMSAVKHDIAVYKRILTESMQKGHDNSSKLMQMTRARLVMVTKELAALEKARRTQTAHV